MTGLRRHFDDRASGPAAYARLREIFATQQAARDRVDVLTARNWLGYDEDTAALKAAALDASTMLNDPGLKVGELLRRAEAGGSKLSPRDRGNLRAMRETFDGLSGYDAAKAIPFIDKTGGGSLAAFWGARETVAELEARNESYALRVKASGLPPTNRQKNRLASDNERLRAAEAQFRDEIEDLVVGIFEDERALLAEPAARLGVRPSDLALQAWNPGVTGDHVDRLLDSVRSSYPAMRRRAIEASKVPAPLPLPPINLGEQRKVFDAIRQAVLAAGGWYEARIKAAGVKEHASVNNNGLSMCWGGPREFYKSVGASRRNLLKGLVAELHEDGHMLYLLGLTEMGEAAQGQPVGRINGYGTHEVSAVALEMLADKREFWDLAAPLIRDTLGIDGPEWTAENLYNLAWTTLGSEAGIDCVTDAAWATTCLRALLDGPGDVRDAYRAMPRLWADSMTAYTGEPHDPADFSLQYDHWVSGMGGYIAYTYLHGAMGATMLHEVTRAAMPDASPPQTLADLMQPYVETLQTHIHRRGREVDPVTMLEDMSGRKVSLGPLLKRLGALDDGDPSLSGPDPQAARTNLSGAAPSR